jgi:hypothetical protein
MIVFATVLLAGTVLGGRAVASQLADEGSGCWEFRDGEVGIYLWCAGDSDLGGWCATLVDDADMNGAAAACATPALLIQKIPLIGVLGIALGIGVLGLLFASAVAGKNGRTT